MEIFLFLVYLGIVALGAWLFWRFLLYDLGQHKARPETVRADNEARIASRRSPSSPPSPLPVTRKQPKSPQIEVRKKVRTRAGALEPR